MNIYFLLKILISSLVIAGVSEVAKRNTFIAALFASLPLTSLLALGWLYYDTRDTGKIIEMCHGIFWMVIPSLAFFVLLPVILKSGVKFWWAMVVASIATSIVYSVFVFIIRKMGVNV